MLCAALSDPFQGQNYRIAATIHEIFLCPILNKTTVLIFSKPTPVSTVKKLRPKFELPLNNSTKRARRVSTDIPLLPAPTRGYHTHEQLSKSVPTTPTSFVPITKSSPISEISLVAEMAAAVAAGSGPVTLMRRLKRNSINLVTTEGVGIVQQRHVAYNNADELVNGECTCATNATGDEYTKPATKID